MDHDWVHRVLQAMRVPKMPRIFVLGCFERRVTIYSQQVRALNLLEALLLSKELSSGDDIAIIGAGMAGLTFAAGAGRRGLRAKVIERDSFPMPLFRKRSKRWLHPYVYDWPTTGWNQSRTGLPVMDWEAGPVPRVLEQLDKAWNSHVTEANGSISEVYNAQDVKLTPVDGGVYVSWNVVDERRAIRPESQKYSIVVLAVGFGTERSSDSDYRGYWEPDDFDVYEGFDSIKEKPREWIVSGCGDGALTDLLRLCIRDFRHDRMIDEFIRGTDEERIYKRIREIEASAQKYSVAAPDFVFREYRSVRDDWVIGRVLNRVRDDTMVTLNATDPYFLQTNSSALNRFLVTQLWHAERFRFIPGRVIGVKREARGYCVEFADGISRHFDRVVLRHGPVPALEETFPLVWASCKPIRELWEQAPHLLDQTRLRYWDAGAFGAEIRYDRADDAVRVADGRDRRSLGNKASVQWTPHCEHPFEPAPHFRGREELLRRLNNWLDDHDSPTRIIALCAIGGTGKTALVERLLRERFKRESSSAGGIFSWSFYEDSRIEAYLGSACEYFAGAIGDGLGGRAERLRAALRSGDPHLLILDGLETVQASGYIGWTRGQIEDHSLKLLLRSIAFGLGRTRALVTSRYPLVDLEGWKGESYDEIALNDLEPDAACGVLRSWGVRGDTRTLDRICESVGRHALSISVLGSYISRFGQGNPSVAPNLDLDAISEQDPKAAKLSRLLMRYSQAMDEDEREVMAIVSMFPRGVGADVLTILANRGGPLWEIFQSESAEKRIVGLLQRLTSSGLVTSYVKACKTVYTAHPFVREHFRKVSRFDVELMYGAIRDLIAPDLERRPKVHPADPNLLERYEDLIEHTLLAGKSTEAFELFWFGLGNYGNLGLRLGEYCRGARVISSFYESGEPAKCKLSISDTERADLVGQWGMFACDLGDLATAQKCAIESIHIERKGTEPRRIANAIRCGARVFLLAGRLVAAIHLADEALDLAKEVHDFLGKKQSHSYAAYSRLLSGNLVLARVHFANGPQQNGTLPRVEHVLWETEMLRLLGRAAEARELCLANLEMCRLYEWARVAARVETLLGHLMLPANLGDARGHLAHAREWVQRTGDIEVALRAHLLASEIAMVNFDFNVAIFEAADGLQLAEACGFGIYAVDLMLALSRARLASGEASGALGHAERAMTRSTNINCGYAWGEADAAHCAGLAHLALNNRDAAMQYFSEAADLRGRLQHPGALDSAAYASRLHVR